MALLDATQRCIRLLLDRWVGGLLQLPGIVAKIPYFLQNALILLFIHLRRAAKNPEILPIRLADNRILGMNLLSVSQIDL